jgi:hypothetical protein
MHPAFSSDLLEHTGVRWRGAELTLASPFYRPPSQLPQFTGAECDGYSRFW